MSGKFKKRLFRVFLVISLLLVAFVAWFAWRIRINYPEIPEEQKQAIQAEIQQKNGLRYSGNNWYRQNEFGLWEVYIEGEPFERGVIYGKLTQKEIKSQEEVFVAQIKKLVPSAFWRQFLKYFVAWFNKDLHKHITPEYQKEIYGVSLAFSDEFDFVGPKYYRILNYHASHDIGHALTDLNMVGCTSFATWDSLSADNKLLIGRNFDFYMGDAFAEDKLMSFVNPDSGYSFASISWAGLMGVVSGMNDQGLTVTLNAAKSEIPTSAKTPISLLAREILQYASTIDEAFAIAQKRETFVSESLLIGSAKDGRAALIEKSTESTILYEENDGALTCANHYQSEFFMKDSANLQNIRNSDSRYRFKRMSDLLEKNYPITPKETANILRDRKGIQGEELGMGNPRALNQLIAHHGVIFQPETKKMWVSANPYQLGAFVCYDLDEVFAKAGKITQTAETIMDTSSLIAPDSFLYTQAYQDFLVFKKYRQEIKDYVVADIPLELTALDVQAYIHSNPESYIVFVSLGDYFQKKKNFAEAHKYYNQALSKEVASLQEEKEIKEAIEKCQKKMK